MSWSKEWPGVGKAVMDDSSNPWFKEIPEEYKNIIKDNLVKPSDYLQEWPKWKEGWLNQGASVGLDLGKDDRTVTAIIKDGQIEKVYNNKVPTHDPYANPNAQIYYQCKCGAILDPGTKSFAALNNAAMNSGWKIRFGHEYYVPYCVKCATNIED